MAIEYELENGSSDLQKQRTQHSAATIVTTPSDKKKIGGVYILEINLNI